MGTIITYASYKGNLVSTCNAERATKNRFSPPTPFWIPGLDLLPNNSPSTAQALTYPLPEKTFLRSSWQTDRPSCSLQPRNDWRDSWRTANKEAAPRSRKARGLRTRPTTSISIQYGMVRAGQLCAVKTSSVKSSIRGGKKCTQMITSACCKSLRGSLWFLKPGPNSTMSYVLLPDSSTLNWPTVPSMPHLARSVIVDVYVIKVVLPASEKCKRNGANRY